MIKKFSEFINESVINDTKAKKIFNDHFDEIVSAAVYDEIEDINAQEIDAIAVSDYEDWTFSWSANGTSLGGGKFDWEPDFSMGVDYTSPDGEDGDFDME